MVGIAGGIFSLIALGASLWIAALAFRRSRTWGFVVLFIPFASLYYVRKFWSETQKPFWLYCGSSIAGFGLILFSLLSVQTGASEAPVTLKNSEGRALRIVIEKKTLSPEEEQAILVMEQTLAIFETLPQTEKQGLILNVLRRRIAYRRSNLSQLELELFYTDIIVLLERDDLNEEQRRDFESMRETLQQDESRLNQLKPIKPDQALSDEHPQKQNMASAEGSKGDKRSGSKKTKAQPSKEEGAEAYAGETGYGAEREREAKPSKPRFRHTSFAQAKNYVGSRARFLGPQGTEKACTLDDVSDHMLQCTERFNSGTFSFSLAKSEITSLKVFR